MTITVRQSALAKDSADPYTVTLGSAIVEGNLLVAVAEERAGATALSMSNAGWTLGAEAYQSPSDGTYRKAHATWYKIAGASEPTTVTVTKTGGDVDAILVGYAEWQGDAGEMATIAFGAGIATGNDNVASFHDSGSTASVASTNKVLIGHCFTKVGSGTEAPYSDWTAGTDDLTEFVELDDSVSGLDGSWAWATSTTSGANSTRATKDGGTTDANRGAIVSLLVFTITTTPTDPGWGHIVLESAAGNLEIEGTTDDYLLDTTESGSTPISGTDTGAGADTSSIAAATTGTDTGSGADAGSLASTLSAADTATSAESASIGLSGADDTGAGADASTLAASVTGADTGSGDDAGTLAAELSGADTAAGTDTASTTVSITASDIATGVDEATVDTGSGDASKTGDDTATGTDTGTLTATGIASETASGIDTGAVAVGTLVAETATAVDSAVVTVTLTGTDTATAADLASLAAIVATAELAAALESGSVVDTGIVIVTPPERTYSVAAETRTSAVAAQSRTTTVLAESRTTEVS